MKHFLILLSCAPNEPNTFRAICGYESTDPKEFTKITDPSTKGVDCEACLEKLKGAVVIVKKENQYGI